MILGVNVRRHQTQTRQIPQKSTQIVHNNHHPDDAAPEPSAPKKASKLPLPLPVIPLSLTPESLQTHFCALSKYIYQVVNGDLQRSPVCNTVIFILVANIFLSFISYMIGSEPSMRYNPSSCAHPACYDDAELCPGTMICEPQALPVFAVIDAICIYVFTFEYGIKLLTYWAVAWVDSPATPTEEAKKAKPLALLYIQFIFAFQNLVDLICILPFWISLNSASGQGQGAVFMRVFRILRVLKFARYLSKKPQQMLQLVLSTLRNSSPALGLLVVLLLLLIIFFGSLVYMLEGGTFLVTEEFPEGDFLRLSSNKAYMERSPFRSIGVSMYWAMVTGITVGYGDVGPTSWGGRAVANIVMIVGILVLALPIGVIGTNFTKLYTEKLLMEWKMASGVLDGNLDEDGMRALFNQFDHDKGGTIDQEEFIAAFRSAGMEESNEFFESLFEKADDDATGEVTVEEFIMMCKKMQLSQRGMALPVKSQTAPESGADNGTKVTEKVAPANAAVASAKTPAKAAEAPAKAAPARAAVASAKTPVAVASTHADDTTTIDDVVKISASSTPPPHVTQATNLPTTIRKSSLPTNLKEQMKAMRDRMAQMQQELDVAMTAVANSSDQPRVK